MKPVPRSQALLQSGLVYFAVVYACGFLAGTARELLLKPALGQTASLLIEAPVMLAVSYRVARWVVRNAGGAGGYLTASEKLAIGLIAFTILIAAEIVLAHLMRGWSFSDWLNHLATTDGLISLLLFVAFALMPVLAPVPRH
jgi:hypothetical protein